MSFLKPKFIVKYTKIYKEGGFKAVAKEGGWTVLILLFLFFLIKGLLWLIIPYLIARGV
tara:strand:- start:517 stop:693 length:177 start_codon:yes stop_codon:yes gene_type:complete